MNSKLYYTLAEASLTLSLGIVTRVIPNETIQDDPSKSNNKRRQIDDRDSTTRYQMLVQRVQRAASEPNAVALSTAQMPVIRHSVPLVLYRHFARMLGVGVIASYYCRRRRRPSECTQSPTDTTMWLFVRFSFRCFACRHTISQPRRH